MVNLESYCNDIGIDFNKCIEFVNSIDSGKYLYPEVVMDKLSITENQSLDLLAILYREGYLEKSYSLFCSSCDSFSEVKFSSINEIEEMECCWNCGEEYILGEDTFKYVAITFKKL